MQAEAVLPELRAPHTAYDRVLLISTAVLDRRAPCGATNTARGKMKTKMAERIHLFQTL